MYSARPGLLRLGSHAVYSLHPNILTELRFGSIRRNKLSVIRVWLAPDHGNEMPCPYFLHHRDTRKREYTALHAIPALNDVCIHPSRAFTCISSASAITAKSRWWNSRWQVFKCCFELAQCVWRHDVTLRQGRHRGACPQESRLVGACRNDHRGRPYTLRPFKIIAKYQISNIKYQQLANNWRQNYCNKHRHFGNQQYTCCVLA